MKKTETTSNILPPEQIIFMQGTGYPYNEEANSQIRKKKETKKLAIAGGHYHAGWGRERQHNITRQVGTRVSLSNPSWSHGGDGSSGKEAN